MIAEWKKVYGMLEDAVSRDIYLRRLNYLVSGDYKYIREILAEYLPDLPPLSGRTMKDFQASLPPDRKIVLYGAGAHGKEQLPYWEHDPRFIGFCCHTKQKQKAGYLGHPCMSPEELLRRKDLTVIVSVVEKKSYGEIMQLLRDGGYPESQIFQARGFSRKRSTASILSQRS